MTTIDPYTKLEYEALTNYTYKPPRLIGIPVDFWISHSEIVAKIIKEYKIESSTAKVSQQRAIKKDVDIRGGIRVPHLHYNGEIYLLNKEQWNKFSGEIIKDFSKKLAEAKNVSFSQLMEISDSMSEIV